MRDYRKTLGAEWSRRLFIALGCIVCLVIGASGPASAAERITGSGQPAASQLIAVYDLVAASTFTYAPNELDDFGKTALSLSGDERLYALWRVLYAYKNSRNEIKLTEWRDRIYSVAHKEGDSNVDLLARFMWQAYINEGQGFSAITDREWDTYLTAPDAALQNIAMIERERQLLSFRHWPEAIDIGETVIVRLEAGGPSAAAALNVAHQTLAYSLTRVGDAEGYAKHMLAAAQLSSNNAFFLQKMDLLYDLTIYAVQHTDIAAAQMLQQKHAYYVKKYKVTELVEWDQQLCAMVADKAEDYAAVINCLSGSLVETGKIGDSSDLHKLRLLILAYAKQGDISRAKILLKKMQNLPSTVYQRDKLYEDYINILVRAASGDSADAFRTLDGWQREMRNKAEETRISSVEDMYSQLRQELDKKTEESRLLVKQVQMQRMLLAAGGVIALLLIVIVAGGAVWVVRMRRLHASLNEAHEHAEAANTAKSRFLAVMSHELRTPLNGVLGMAQALRKKDDLNPTQLEQVNILVDSGQTLLALLNDVLDMSRIEAGKVELAPSPASLKDTMERVVNTYRSLVEAKGLTLRYDLDPSAEPLMLFDVLRVYQCLSNLVSNAVKFTEKGSVRILVSAEERRGGGYVVRCEVRDTGIGMTKSVIDRLFEAYSQADAMTVRKYGGSGLGLNISRRLAELMGGALTVTSQEGVGSAFVMTFKAEAAAEEAPHAEAPSQAILAEEDEALPGMHILLVDDHPVNRKVARLFLEPFGFVITEAADGQEALDLDMSRFDLVLMDLNMPKMGGLEATRLFRAAETPGRHVPIVALTADAMKDQIESCYAAGMDAHIAKPIIMDTLIGTVTQLLHLQSDETDARPAAVTAN